MFGFLKKSLDLPTAETALPGRPDAIPTSQKHVVNGQDLRGVPQGLEEAFFALGCFWGAERLFWKIPGVFVTAVGYQGGITPNPTYEEVCSGRTGHTEVVRVVFDPRQVTYEALLKAFWEGHNPTQGMQQGNDVGTQYRSAIYTTSAEQQSLAEASRLRYEQALKARGLPDITTEIAAAPVFFYAEDYHQQYLARNPGGYCGLGGTGVSCPAGVAAE